ncbi:PREDICTED: uncharacterized protein LOC108750948, partial [Trachymyrmex septentrionalis]|uniref:uncharacterized protein LOC108750948 n=1 Tax=Trachymyrmex septentrionalis TaxID=34720 RepID=UPI00084EEC21
MAQQRPEDIVQLHKEYRSDAKDNNQLFKCEYCIQESKPDFISDHVTMIRHLYETHYKSEIMEDPEYESVARNFDLSRQYQKKIDVGKCLKLKCDAKIKSKFGKALPFKNHSVTHHEEDKKSFFAKAVKIVSGQKILDNYEIKDTEFANCSFCRKPLPLENLDSHPAEILSTLSDHWNEHISVDTNIKRKGATIENKLENLKEKRREAAMQISHQAERPEQRSSSDDEDVPGFSGIPRTSTQSSLTVEYMPRQSSSSDGGGVPVSGGMQSTSTQSSSIEELPSKQKRLDS